MRSTHVEQFNHDDDAAGYDRDVANESHPIRAGYDALLSWVAEQVPPNSLVVDLGCGTGNLARRVDSPAKLIAIDISDKMMAIARGKLSDVPCDFVKADLLECFEALGTVDAIISTYAIHHLTGSEKARLFEHVHDHLRPGGVATFGDLMFESEAARAAICTDYERAGQATLVADINDEFFWILDEALAQLNELGFETTVKRFSQLSFGVRAVKPAAAPAIATR